jgi:YD repeat-containing protein
MTTSKQYDGFHPVRYTSTGKRSSHRNRATFPDSTPHQGLSHGVNRLRRISSTPSADSAVSFNYGYNLANQRSSVTNADNSRWAYGYDNLGQVTSGKKYWADGTPVAGQHEYSFDDIGNRKTASRGGDATGANLRTESYTANSLNQYTQRTVPGAVDILGTVHADSTVTVNNRASYRKGDYFWNEYLTNNSSSSLY